MRDKLRAYIDSLFADAPKTRKAYELKEELLSNLNAKYDDMIQEGHSDEEAYQAAVGSIGDVGELIGALDRDGGLHEHVSEAERKKFALMVSGSIALYIVAVVPLLLLQNVAGLILLLVIAAAATGILIYSSMSRPKYYKADETVVEEFKQWNRANSDKIRIRKSISSVLWTLIVVVYLVVSFATFAWYITWIIFLIGAAIENIIKLAFELKG